MSKTIAFVSGKSSVGKTTSVANIAARMVQEGRRVCVVDLDPQCTLSKWFGILEPAISLHDLISAYIENEADETVRELVCRSIHTTAGIDVIPTVLKMGSLENRIPMATCREHIVESILSHIREDYDFILIDCLAMLGNLVINAMTAADSVMIPVEPDMTSFDGLNNVKVYMDMVKRRSNPHLHIEGIIITRYRQQPTYNRNMLSEILSYFVDEQVYPDYINFSVRVAECYAEGKSIFEHAPSSPAAAAYANIAKVVMDHAKDQYQQCG